MVLTVMRMKYFVSIAEQASLTKASSALGIAQPALSHHIRLLEEDLNVKLMTRTSRGIHLTEAGDTLLVHCQTILHSIQRAEHAVREKSAVPSGDVIVGLVGSISPIISAPLIRACRQHLPNIRLFLREGDSQTLRSGLEMGSYDIAINLSEVAGNNSSFSFKENLYVVAPFGHFTGKNPTIALEEAMRLPLILPSRKHGIRMLIEREAERAGLKLDVSIEIEGAGSIKSAVRERLGMTIMGWSSMTTDRESRSFSTAVITSPTIARKFVLLMAQRSQATNAVLAVRRKLEEIIADISAAGHWMIEA